MAPYATASSGLIESHNFLPLKKVLNNSRILGIRVDPPTNTISSIDFLEILESRITFSTGSIVFLNKCIFISSNFAREIVELKSIPSYSASISIKACVDEDSVRLALSHDERKRRSALGSELISFPRFFFLNSLMK